MKERFRLLCGIISALMLLSSCQSVYVEPHVPGETTGTVEVDLDEEYFTTGYLREEVAVYDGCLYGDSWIYIEYNSYDKYLGTSSKKEDLYQNQQVLRIVKANAHTGQVSSICIDPVCNHSPGSGCIAVAPLGASMALVQGVVDDWVMFAYSVRNRESGMMNTSNYIYNMKTGELLDIFENNTVDMVMTQWSSRCPYENKLYGVKHLLDYTGTGYVPGSGTPSDYKPKTKSILCVLDFDTRETKELFEIPADYMLVEITNKRFILSDETREKFYSIDYNGENLTEMDVLDFSPISVCGTYAYGKSEDEFYIYDLATNTKKVMPMEGVLSSYTISPVGIVKRTMSNTEEYEKVFINHADEMEAFVAQKQKENPDYDSGDISRWVSEFSALLVERRETAIYKMRCTVSLIKDMHGEGEEIALTTVDNGIITTSHTTEKYLYCTISVGDPNNDYKKIECEATGYFIIDLETGESKEIPYLELIIPHEDRKPE